MQVLWIEQGRETALRRISRRESGSGELLACVFSSATENSIPNMSVHLPEEIAVQASVFRNFTVHKGNQIWAKHARFLLARWGRNSIHESNIACFGRGGPRCRVEVLLCGALLSGETSRRSRLIRRIRRTGVYYRRSFILLIAVAVGGVLEQTALFESSCASVRLCRNIVCEHVAVFVYTVNEP